MKMSAAGWIGVIIGCLGGLAGLTVAIIASPVFGSIMAVIFIAIFGGVFGSLFRGAAVKNKLLKTGVSATARVVKVSDTGVTVNNSPQIKILLEVTPPNGSPYMVETKELISRLDVGVYREGMILTVKVDLDNKNLVAIDNSGGDSSGYAGGYSSGSTGFGAAAAEPTSVPTGPWAGMSAAEANQKLVTMNEQNVTLMSYGTEAKAIIRRYTWLGIYVNGQNPAVQLDIEVLPDSGSPFEGTAFGVVQAASIPKYQPGCQVYVKYDPNDTSKITMFHS